MERDSQVTAEAIKVAAMGDGLSDGVFKIVPAGRFYKNVDVITWVQISHSELYSRLNYTV